MSEPPRPATYEDLCGLRDGVIGEIIDGELYASPRPAGRHAFAIAEVGADLVIEFRRKRRGPGGWWILIEPELHLGADVLVPDIAGWRRERMPQVPDVAAFELAPDWVLEVLSPSTARLDRYRKLPVYARHGVRHAWIVDPLLRSLEVYRLHGEHWLLVATHEGDAPLRAEPFEDAELDPSEWWIGPDDQPPPTSSSGSGSSGSAPPAR